MYRNWLILSLVLLLGWTSYACTEEDTPEKEQTSLCGNTGESIEVNEQTICVYEQAVVIETGFRCPPNLPMQQDYQDIATCTQAGSDFSETEFEQARMEFFERRDIIPMTTPEPTPEPDPVTDCVDNDGDGFLSMASENCDEETLDCDDNDANINPDAEEVEDNVDNDCDGEVDERDNVRCIADEDCSPGQSCVNSLCTAQ